MKKYPPETGGSLEGENLFYLNVCTKPGDWVVMYVLGVSI
jgi:hypothetical protein